MVWTIFTLIVEFQTTFSVWHFLRETDTSVQWRNMVRSSHTQQHVQNRNCSDKHAKHACKETLYQWEVKLELMIFNLLVEVYSWHKQDYHNEMRQWMTQYYSFSFNLRCLVVTKDWLTKLRYIEEFYINHKIHVHSIKKRTFNNNYSNTFNLWS